MTGFGCYNFCVVTKTIQTISLEPFDANKDQALLKTWLERPHIRRWWGDPDEQLAQIMSPPVGCHQALIIADDVPVGYIQWEQVLREELDTAGLTDIPEGALDVDIAIGEQDYIGQGIGSRAIGLVIDSVSHDQSIPMIIMATSVENVVAQRSFEKAGFHRVRKFEDPGYGPMYLFIYGKNENPS